MQQASSRSTTNPPHLQPRTPTDLRSRNGFAAHSNGAMPIPQAPPIYNGAHRTEGMTPGPPTYMGRSPPNPPKSEYLSAPLEFLLLTGAQTRDMFLASSSFKEIVRLEPHAPSFILPTPALRWRLVNTSPRRVGQQNVAERVDASTNVGMGRAIANLAQSAHWPTFFQTDDE